MHNVWLKMMNDVNGLCVHTSAMIFWISEVATFAADVNMQSMPGQHNYGDPLAPSWDGEHSMGVSELCESLRIASLPPLTTPVSGTAV